MADFLLPSLDGDMLFQGNICHCNSVSYSSCLHSYELIKSVLQMRCILEGSVINAQCVDLNWRTASSAAWFIVLSRVCSHSGGDFFTLMTGLLREHWHYLVLYWNAYCLCYCFLSKWLKLKFHRKLLLMRVGSPGLYGKPEGPQVPRSGIKAPVSVSLPEIRVESVLVFICWWTVSISTRHSELVEKGMTNLARFQIKAPPSQTSTLH